MRKQFLVFLILLTMFSSGAIASEPTILKRGAFELGAFGGISLLDNYGTFIDGSNVDMKNGVVVGGRIGYFLTDNLSIEPWYRHVFSETSTNLEAPLDSARLNLLWNFHAGKRFIPFITVGGGWEFTDIGTQVNDDTWGVNGGVGFRYLLNDGFGLRFDARYVGVDVGGAVDTFTHNSEYTAGIFVAFGAKARKKFVDSDGDGVEDQKDACPNTPAGIAVNSLGCEVDSDSDGVADRLDKCPNTKSGLAVGADGCELDTDGDNVVDRLDKCPNTPKGAIIDEEGCAKDSDGDGVVDYKDVCPGTVKGETVDAKGCPQVNKARGVLKGVTFELGKAVLTENAKSILQGVASTLANFPDVRVEVQGHSDSSGDATFNQQLSSDRARSVANYLVLQGIPKERLSYRGYGESNPIADNNSKAGRQINRRVELKWLD